jgi:hypothetical protein
MKHILVVQQKPIQILNYYANMDIDLYEHL